jgi:ribosomal protein S17
MKKTATVTVSRWVIHKLTGKVWLNLRRDYKECWRLFQQIERSKKFLVHDEKNGKS